VTRQQRQQREIAAAVERGPVCGADGAIGVDRAQLDASIRSWLELRVRAQADRRVDRRRAVVKEIERPDVDGAARQIDAGRRRRNDAHTGIIRIPNPDSLIPIPECFLQKIRRSGDVVLPRQFS
jgi:hypothetical protein